MKHLKYLFLALIIMSCSNDDDANEPLPIIDLEAEFFVLDLVSGSPSNGEITIIGVVRNVGDDFSSSTGQQSIVLYEKPIAGSETEVARTDFTDLGANETLQLPYTRTWSTSNEFPPEYILKIVYDPDIFIDGNVNNDDTNSENDSLNATGYEIHDILNSLF